MNRKNWVISFFIVLTLVFGSDVFAQNVLQDAIVKAGLKMEDVRAVTTFYYQNPQPEKMMSVLKVLVTVKEFTSDSQRFPMIAHIFSTVAHSNKSVLEQMVILKDSMTGESKTILENLIKGAENFHSFQGDSQEHMNFLWAEFFATGQKEPVKKIIDALGSPMKDLSQKSLVSFVNWSLTSNVKQHKRVHEIVKEESANQTGLVKQMLEQMIKDADKS